MDALLFGHIHHKVRADLNMSVNYVKYLIVLLSNIRNIAILKSFTVQFIFVYH